jgi:molybdate transport system substrate-binding protein
VVDPWTLDTPVGASRAGYSPAVPPVRLAVVLLAAAALVASCGGGSPAAESGGEDPTGTITVFAASSLAGAFTELAEDFETRNPRTDIVLNFAGSSALAAQIIQGAPVDVFASADTENMARLVTDGRIDGGPTFFAANSAVIIVEKGNPRGITGVADLARPGLVVVACAVEVPCGRYARSVLDNTGVEARLSSFEDNVRAVVTKVVLGEADAGIVYLTDALATGDSAGWIDIPADVNVIARYPIAVLKDAKNATVARAFIDFVSSPRGRAILVAHGFGPP